MTLRNEKTLTGAKSILYSGVENANTRYYDGSRPLHWAHTAAIAELLILMGAKVNTRDSSKRSPLHVAVSRNVSIIKLLINNGAYVNARDNQGNTPLHYTTRIDVVCELVRNGANVNALNHDREAPIYMRCYNSAVVKALIEYGADIKYLYPNRAVYDTWKTYRQDLCNIQTRVFEEDLIKNAWHPKRLLKWCCDE